MIELKHFIAQTLTEIVEGVVEAQDRALTRYGGKRSMGQLTLAVAREEEDA